LLRYIHPVSPGPNAHLFAIIRQALADAGFVEGHNLTIESRFAEGHYELLPQLVSELVSRSPAVIIAANTPAALAAKAVHVGDEVGDASRAPSKEDMLPIPPIRDAH
jgi:putative ABC transport system substrate-binding protein